MRAMERLTERNNKRYSGKYKAKDNVWTADCIEKLGEYEDLEDNGLLLLLPCKDKLINALAEIAINSEFGRCYMCTNSMKNITLDGVNNGCDGNCGHERFTTDDFIKKVVEELRYKSEAEQKLKEMEGE